MIFKEAELPGAYVIEPEPRPDHRGFFARVWCRQEFEAQGLELRVAQVNVSYNALRGTLRGMHYQAAPHAEAKVVRCTRGAIFDAIVDVRPGSAMYGAWTGLELSEENRRILYVPEGFAHGFQTLADGTEVTYQVSESYHPQSERGLRWDDPAIGIRWPLAVTAISEKDRSWPDFRLAPVAPGEPGAGMPPGWEGRP